MKIKLGAVIPTVQYGNLQPEIEIDCPADGMSEDDAKTYAESHIQALWDKYGEKPLIAKTGDRKLIKCFVGGEIYFDEVNHVYTNEAGEVYLSGSTYAKQFEKPFDMQGISQKMADKSGVPVEDIQRMWEMKRDISNGFGTAIHAALELYGKYNGHAEAFEKQYHLHDQPHIKKAVESFYKLHTEEGAEYEAVIVDHKTKRAGCVDRLEFVPNTTGATAHDKVVRVTDFKTNTELTKDKLENYWHQLSFYAAILEAGGYTVDSLVIYHWNGIKWETHEHEVLDVNK